MLIYAHGSASKQQRKGSYFMNCIDQSSTIKLPIGYKFTRPIQFPLQPILYDALALAIVFKALPFLNHSIWGAL